MANLLYLELINDIEEKINSGILKEGDKLPSERELAQNKQVSRNVVREAIKVLKEKGLVTIKHGKGAYITKPSYDNLIYNIQNIIQKYDTSLEDLLEVREELELLIIKKVIERASEKDINYLKQIYNEMEDSKYDINKFIELDLKFHLTLAEATQNKIYYVLSQTFFDLSEKLLINLTRFTNDIVLVQEQHRNLIDAIKQRDVENATRIMKKHIHSSNLK